MKGKNSSKLSPRFQFLMGILWKGPKFLMLTVLNAMIWEGVIDYTQPPILMTFLVEFLELHNILLRKD
jgi:hypothetical protein